MGAAEREAVSEFRICLTWAVTNFHIESALELANSPGLAKDPEMDHLRFWYSLEPWVSPS